MVEIATTSTNAATKRALKQAMHKFKILPDEISIANKNITRDIANITEDTIEIKYNSFINSLQHDHQDHTHKIYKIKNKDSGYRVIVEGNQVLYDEFGTGIVGFNNPHPEKNRYHLNGYNTGPMIHHSSNSNKDYWVYFADNKFVTTHGVPAGMFMYDTFMDISENIARNIATEQIQKTIKKNFGKGK